MIDARQHVTGRGGRFKVLRANIIGKAAHHSVSGGSFMMAGQTAERDEVNHIRMVDQYHASIGFGGFAYQACGFPSGRAYQTGDFDGARAHVWARNHELLGWVLIGNYENQLPSAGGLTAAAECERAFDAYLGRQVPLKGHMDWALPGHGTACPGRIRERLATIRNLVREDDMTPEQEQLLLTIQSQMNQMIEAHRQGGSHYDTLAIVQGQLNQLITMHQGSHGSGAGGGAQKVRFPGASVSIPPIDMTVEDA